MTAIPRAIWALVLAPTLAWGSDRMLVADFSRGVDGRGIPNEWQLKEKAGRADFSVMNCDGFSALRMRSTSASFSFQRRVQADLKQYPLLRWKWKVTSLPNGGDFRKTKTDDEAAQLFVAFSKTRAIVYVWDTTAPAGLMANASSPPFMSIKAVVVRSGPADLGKWMSETRDVYDDYRRLYGTSGKPPVVLGMRLQINSQHTQTVAESAFAEVRFASDNTDRRVKMLQRQNDKAPTSGNHRNILTF